jgi:hypothetical protein
VPTSPPDSYGAEDWAPVSGGAGGAPSWESGSGSRDRPAQEAEPRRGGHARPEFGAEFDPDSRRDEPTGGWHSRSAPLEVADADLDAPGFADAGFNGAGFADAGFDGAGFDGAGAGDGPDAVDQSEPREPRSVPEAPVRRVLSLAMAGLAGLLSVAMVVGAQLTPESYGLVVFGAQALFVVVWTVASQPPGGLVVAGVGIAVAVGADLASALVNPASLAPLAYLTAGGFILAVLGQLLRPAGRVRVTESLGSSLVVVLGVVAFATLIVLGRRPLGDQVIVATVVAVGVSLIVAHLVDTVAPVPRVAPAVPRGGAGVVVGAMVGTAAAGVAGQFLEGLSPLPTALAGLVAAVIALMVDLSANYAEASRRLAGAPPALWLVRHMQGPLVAFALAAPTAYAASLLLARGL